MGVHIIAGQWKGRRLETPPGLTTRPMTGRIRQSLCDRLATVLPGARVADVCAGCGSFGLEAASRGAASVHLIEKDPAAIRCLRSALTALGHPAGVILHDTALESALPTLSGLDLVFADPPFPWFRDDPAALGRLLALCQTCLGTTGRLLIRGERGQDLPLLPAGLQEEDRFSYGRSWIADLRPVMPSSEKA